jgi:hypothetical protein
MITGRFSVDVKNFTEYLLEESRLPGPRANLELAFAYAIDGEIQQFKEYADIDAVKAPQNTKMEFLAFCGTLGLWYHLDEAPEGIQVLRRNASDPRWRVREAVALGLQKWGSDHPTSMLDLMSEWAKGPFLEKRAVVATLCEPNLLISIDQVSMVFELLDYITSSVEDAMIKDDGFKALRKALGYGWSVAVTTHPSIGKPHMERWVGIGNRDIRWVMKQNLMKKRLLRMNEEWVTTQRGRLDE